MASALLGMLVAPTALATDVCVRDDFCPIDDDRVGSVWVLQDKALDAGCSVLPARGVRVPAVPDPTAEDDAGDAIAEFSSAVSSDAADPRFYCTSSTGTI